MNVRPPVGADGGAGTGDDGRTWTGAGTAACTGGAGGGRNGIAIAGVSPDFVAGSVSAFL